jgi:hypothetical protein
VKGLVVWAIDFTFLRVDVELNTTGCFVSGTKCLAGWGDLVLRVRDCIVTILVGVYLVLWLLLIAL